MILTKILKYCLYRLTRIKNLLERTIFLTRFIFITIKLIPTKLGPIKFKIENYTTYLRAKSLLTKEPEKISWIQQMSEKQVFWDIGANIGTFSLFAAQKKTINK